MTRKKKTSRRVRAKVEDGKQTLKAADTAGADYAHEQISGSYFADWVYDQLANPPANPLPLATKADARVVARNMLQQLEWDTKRELEPHTILGLSGAAGGGGARSKEVVAAFYKGFDRVLKDPKVVDWLADEILSAGRHGQVAEARGRRAEPLPNNENRKRLASYIAHLVMYDKTVHPIDLVRAYHLSNEEANAILGPSHEYFGPGGKSYAQFEKHVEKSLKKKEWFSAPDPKAIPGAARGYGRYVWLLENAAGGDQGAKDKSDIEDLQRELSNVGFNGWGLAIDNWPEAQSYYNAAPSVYRRHARSGMDERHVVSDYIAVDRNDRRIAGPFRSRHEAERHVPPGGYVKFSSATRRQAPPPPSSYPMFRESTDKSEAELIASSRCPWEISHSKRCGRKVAPGHTYCPQHERDWRDLYPHIPLRPAPNRRRA